MQLLCIAEHIVISFIPSVRPYLLTYLLTYFRPPVSEMTYTVSSGTLNSTIPYHTLLPSFLLSLTPSLSPSFFPDCFGLLFLCGFRQSDCDLISVCLADCCCEVCVLVVGFKRQLVVGCWENRNKRLDWTPLPGNWLWLGRDWYTCRKSTTRQQERRPKLYVIVKQHNRADRDGLKECWGECKTSGERRFTKWPVLRSRMTKNKTRQLPGKTESL